MHRRLLFDSETEYPIATLRGLIGSAMQYDGSMGALLDIRDLQIRFGAAEAVRGISLQVDEGEVLGLVGESGSGKSATALAVLGLLGPAAQVEGQILWRGTHAGVDLLRQPEEAMRRLRGREIAMIFQEPMTALNPVMTIGRKASQRMRPRGRGERPSEKPWLRSKQWRFRMRRGATATILTSFPAASGRGF
jgi:ABC-type glutathione transport system ATPase component